MKKAQSNVMNLAMGGMMGALIFVATYMIKLPVSITQGYIHLGDGFILLGAALLGPLAIPAAAIGSISVQPDEDAVEETPAEQNESAPGESTASHESADPTPADTDTDDYSKN